jgi:acrylyl-CoA reductase (NADPH)
MKDLDLSGPVRAVVIRQKEGEKGHLAAFEDLTLGDLPDYDVLVEVSHSTLNYKDGLALTGGRIARRLPMVAGIDLAGTVVASDAPDYRPGDRVFVNGYGLSETEWGGYSTFQRLKSEWLLPAPESLSAQEVMAIGTAGYTAMLCVMALLEAGLAPGDGPVLVTGAAGGVGSVAIGLLARRGFQVTASTGRTETHAYLRELGASEIADRGALTGKPASISAEQWAGAIDCVGGATLANLISQMKYGACVAACGLAGGADLPGSVFPFILRGVRLQGIDSVMASRPRRQQEWKLLAEEIDRAALAKIAEIAPFERVFDLAPRIVAGQVRGRVVLQIK